MVNIAGMYERRFFLEEAVAAGVRNTAQHCQGAADAHLRITADFTFKNWQFDFFFLGQYIVSWNIVWNRICS